ncbi:beta-ketoacyl synthase N-terminal-like domain-containing protein [Serratia plymuthica]|uniref:beta-ketoacyl synthase N-terminal-like domain-containing protein n=1 Tax=Serratia plymuthica TaxID=82996 RepID=UPI0002DB2EE7|nr:beta-ketoacyl synthase N-terminal-like domain-containing protein [Serratia plymuthica]
MEKQVTKQNNDSENASILNNIHDKEIAESLSLDEKKDAVAIIGIGGFFPGADSIEDFCRKLDKQASLFSPVPDNHFPGPEMRNRYGAFFAQYIRIRS